MRQRTIKMAGFTLLPVVLAMSLIAAIAFLLNRDNGMNTDMVVNQMNTDRARYAAEAGLQSANARVQSLSCAGGFPVIGSPVINSNFGGAGYSAYATTSSGNTTNLVSTGTYNGTSVTLTRNNIYVYQATPQTFTIQPNSTVGKDTYIEINNNKNFGVSNVIWGYPNFDFPMFKFDLSAFPAGSLPLSSTFSLYQKSASAGTGSILIYRLQTSWLEGTGSNPADGANWSTSDGTASWPAGGFYHPSSVTSMPYVSNSDYWANYDVSDLAAAWMSGRYPNEGVIVGMNPGVGSIKYVSREDSNSSQRPKITFNYLVPCGATGPSNSTGGTLTLNPIADAYVDNGATQKTLNYGITTLLQTFTGGRAAQMMAKFDVSNIPAGTVIKTATLRYNVSTLGSKSSNKKPITAYKLIESWIEGTKNGSGTANGVTALTRDGTTVWTNASGTYDVTAIAMAMEESSGTSPPPGTFSSGWLTWNLTALVQEWVDSISPNNGVILVPSTISGKDIMSFDSKEASSNKPQLVVTY